MIKNTILATLFGILFPVFFFGQINSTVPPPEFEKFQPVSPNQSHTPKTQSNQLKNQSTSLRGNNSMPVFNSKMTTPDAIFNKLNYNNISLNANSFIPPKQVQSMMYLQGLVKELNKEGAKIQYDLPDAQNLTLRKHFEKAYSEIVLMLNGTQKLSLKRAVFLTENAFFDNNMGYEDYCSLITDMAIVIKLNMKQRKLQLNNLYAVNYMVHQYMSDTLTFQLNGKKMTTYPKTYDFEDPFGYKDSRKMFVSKLMKENKGQCKSMPLLFLILVEELGGKAYLSFSPSHSFIKCRGENGAMYSIELTNGRISRDSWIVASGFVKSEAVKSGIFLDTLNKKQVVANCLVDLAEYYRWRFMRGSVLMGYDKFNLKCVNQTLKYHPQNINALLEKSNYYSALLKFIATQKGYKTEQQFINDPKTNEVYIQMNRLFALTDGLGYEYLPESEYTKWLNSSFESNK